MSISIAWDNPEHTTVRLDVPQNWTWAEISQVQIAFAAMIQRMPCKVDLILDLSQTRRIPNGAFSNIRYFSYGAPSETGLVVLVKANPTFRVIVHQFQKLTPNAKVHFDFADSLEEARTFLANKRNQRASEAGSEQIAADREHRTA